MRRWFRYVAAGLAALVMVMIAAAPAESGGGAWPPLGSEGIYDPDSEAVGTLQSPAQALEGLPPAATGNRVDWVEALRRGLIAPRSEAVADGQPTVLDLDVPMMRTASMPGVTFPHRQHTEWLTCSNCHPRIFLPQKAANPITMYSIMRGEYCGVCHGKVAFPPADCFRCHNQPK